MKQVGTKKNPVGFVQLYPSFSFVNSTGDNTALGWAGRLCVTVFEINDVIVEESDTGSIKAQEVSLDAAGNRFNPILGAKIETNLLKREYSESGSNGPAIAVEYSDVAGTRCTFR